MADSGYVPRPYVRQPYTPDTRSIGALLMRGSREQATAAAIRGATAAQLWQNLAQGFQQYQNVTRQQAEKAASVVLHETERKAAEALKRDELAERKAEREETNRLRQETATRQQRMDARDVAQDFGRVQAPGPISQDQMDLTQGDPATFARTRYAFGPGTAQGPELMPTPEQIRQTKVDEAAAAERAAQGASRLRDDVRADKTLEATLANQKVMQGIAQQNANIAAANSQARLGGGASTLSPAYRNALERVISNVPANRRGPKLTHAQRLFDEQNEPELKDFIRQNAIEGENVDVKNQVLGRMATIASLKDTQDILKEMKAKGVPTNIIAGSAEDVARKLGTSTNPEYVALGNRLAGTLINYRRAATGVAFGEKEGAQYARMFPSYKNTMPVNLALIDGLMREMNTYDKAYWEHKLGKDGAALILGASEAAPTGKANPNR